MAVYVYMGIFRDICYVGVHIHAYVGAQAYSILCNMGVANVCYHKV